MLYGFLGLYQIHLRFLDTTTLPSFEERSKVWNNLNELHCINSKLENFNQLFYFVKL